MTDIFNDDETKKAHQEKSFKEQILEQMRQASRQREELLAQEERARQEAALALKKAEEARLEAERQAQLAEEEARRQAVLEAELAQIAREEEERKAAERRALYEAEQAELARQEAARREAEYQAHLAEEEARETARQAEKARLTQEIVKAREQETTSHLTAEDETISSSPVYTEDDIDETYVWKKAEQPADFASESGVSTPSTSQEVAGSSLLDFDDLDVEVEELNKPATPTRQAKPKAKPNKAVKKVSKQSKTNRLAKKISLALATLLLALILATGAFGYFYVSSALKPVDANSTEFVQVEIPSGSGNKLIGKILEEKGVIKSGTVFNYYTKFKNYSGFGSGYYNFQKSMDLEKIIAMLKEGGTEEPVMPPLGRVLVPEGYTITQIAKAVTLNSATDDKSDKAPFTEEAFLKVVQDEEFIARMVEKYPDLLGSLPDASQVKYRLEGYLFPATYDYYESTTIEELVEHMLATMDSKLAPYYSQIANRNMTVNEILSLASLVEKEGQTDDDRRQIASVFYNRMAIDMPLQSNIAILYALNKLGDKTSLAEDAAVDTSIDSPYNIYLKAGLTPGPVDSPSLSAIEASIEPAKTDYLYFVADVTTGVVYYAETFDEHNANVEKYVNSHLN